MRDISELIKKQESPPPPENMSAEDFTHQEYLNDIARMRDFTPEEERIRWPTPVKPLWKN